MSSDVYSLKKDIGLKYDTKDIGRHITKLRLQKKLSMHRLAYEACVDATVLMRIEKGERVPMLDTLLKIIDGLKLLPADFFKAFN
jgi:transcriptional regulator with XRE-family HTH domain